MPISISIPTFHFLSQILLLDISCDELCGQTLSSGGDVVNHLAWQPDITPNIGLKMSLNSAYMAYLS